jgi:hypothetical protein
MNLVSMTSVLFVVSSAPAWAISCAGQQRGAPRQDLNGDVRERLIGAWRLASLEEPGADGQLHRAECTGSLVFTRDGHMAVQVMYQRPQPDGSSVYASGGSEASFGTFDLDERARTFTFRVEGALVRSLIGKDLPRAFALSDNRLTVSSTKPTEHWRVVWER